MELGNGLIDFVRTGRSRQTNHANDREFSYAPIAKNNFQGTYDKVG
jgi:hypothetical protein